MAWWSRAVELKQWSDQASGIYPRSYWAGDNVLNVIQGLPLDGSAPATVKQALQVPAVSRAVALNSVVAAGSPWTAADTSATDQLPAWLNKTYGVIPAGKRRAGLVQDMLLHNQSLLAVARENGAIVDALHWPVGTYKLNELGQVEVKDERGAWQLHKSQDQFIWIPGLLPMSFMEYAAESIHQYVNLCRTITQRTKSPIPLVELKVTEDWEGSRAELEAAQKAWNTARQAEGGATAVTPKGVSVIIHPGDEDRAMLIEARNAIRIDFANYTNLNASIVDGASGASDTYSNTLQDANEFLRLSLGLWTLPITQRLSQDDVTPEGLELAWDHSKFDLAPAQGNSGQAVAAPAPLPIGK